MRDYLPAVGGKGVAAAVRTGPSPQEVCSECGKAIAKRAIAHVWEDRVVCTACCSRLHRAADEAEAKEGEKWEVDHEPPSYRQLRFCKELGVEVSTGQTKWDVCRMITAKLEELHERNAETVVTIKYAPQKKGAGEGCFMRIAIVIVLLLVALVVWAITSESGHFR